MARSGDHLGRWLEAGLLDEATAERIRAFEASQPQARRGPSLLEVLVYLGLAVVVVGALILIGLSWEGLSDWQRVTVAGVPAALALVAGPILRSSGQPALDRGAQVAWLAAAALATLTAAVLADTAGLGEENVALVAGLTALPVASLLWVLAPSHPQVVGVGAGGFMLSFALGIRSEDHPAALFGLFLAGLAVVAIVLTELAVFRPMISGRLVAGFCFAFGAAVAAMAGGPAEAGAFVAAAALIALSLARGVFAYLVFGVADVFIGLINSVIRHVGSPQAAAAALIVIGILMIATVILLARTRPWARGGPRAAPA
jgi:hypothetical protein